MSLQHLHTANTCFATCIACLLLLTAVGCGDTEPAQNGPTKPPANAAVEQHTDGDEQAGEEHAGDEHGHGDEEQHAFGPVDVGSVQVRGIIYGDVKPGTTVPVDVIVDADASPAIRLWVGIESAAGSMRIRARQLEGRQHGDVPVPDPLPADARLWVEVDTAGQRTAHSFDLPG